MPAAQLEQSRQQLAALQSHVEQAVDEYKSAYPTQLKFDYVYKANEAPFDIQSIYHDDKFTYIKTNAPEKFSVYEMKDGKPNLVTYDLREGTYIIPKIMDSGYVELGKKKMEFTRKGSAVMTENIFTPHTRADRAASRANVAPQPGTAKRSLAEEPQDLRLSGCGIARDCGGALQFVRQEDARDNRPARKANHRNRPCRTTPTATCRS